MSLKLRLMHVAQHNRFDGVEVGLFVNAIYSEPLLYLRWEGRPHVSHF